MRHTHLKKQLVTLIAFSSILAASAGTWRYWLSSPKNDWDWTDPDNFDSRGVPTAEDYVLIPAGKTVRVKSSDAASLAIVTNGSFHISLDNGGAKVVFEIGEGLDITNMSAICTAWGGKEQDLQNGSLVKSGSGRLTLAYPGTGDTYRLWYFTCLHAAEGELRLQPRENYRCVGVLSADENANLVIEWNSWLYASGIAGAGRILRTAKGTLCLNGDGMKSRSAFTGVLGENINLNITSGQDLFSTNSLNYNVEIGGNAGKAKKGPFAGIARFGNANEPSSIGTNGMMQLALTGAGLRYLGTSERTTKNFFLKGRTAESGTLSFLDGGPNGGLDLAGTLEFCGWYGSWYQFVFDGDHTNACVFSGTTLVDDVNRRVYVSKDGTGTWKFTGTKSGISGVAVRNGTLQFDSIAEKGNSSSLGTADILTEEGSGGGDAWLNEHAVSYAYKLGATNEQGVANGTALLEYVGETAAKVTTRPAVLAARGGFKSSAASFDFTGVSALDAVGTKTLLLDGETVTNTVRNVTDGIGKVGIEKSGSGTWILEGTNTFTGPVAVNAGRLVLATPYRPYTWYRLNIQSIMGANGTGGGNHFSVAYIGLYDKDGLAVSDNITNAVNNLTGSGTAADYAERMKAVDTLQPGQAAFQPRVEVRNTTESLSADLYEAFRFGSETTGGFVMKDQYWTPMTPVPETASTWGRLVFRPCEGANPAVSYDFVRTGSKEWRAEYQIRSWSLDASFDGKVWEEIDASRTKDYAGQYGNYWAISNGSVDFTKANVHKIGAAIAWRSPTARTVLPTAAESWSVASGATLMNEDPETPLAVDHLVVDASRGIGAFEGIRFCETGILDISNVALSRGTWELRLKGDYSKSEGFENVRGWTIRTDERTARRYTISFDGDTIVIRKKGFVLFLR